MEIKATGTLDFQTMRAFTHLCMFKKANPKKNDALFRVLCTCDCYDCSVDADFWCRFYDDYSVVLFRGAFSAGSFYVF